jgi:hypothetical protein
MWQWEVPMESQISWEKVAYCVYHICEFMISNYPSRAMLYNNESMEGLHVETIAVDVKRQIFLLFSTSICLALNIQAYFYSLCYFFSQNSCISSCLWGTGTNIVAKWLALLLSWLRLFIAFLSCTRKMSK